tara:strand:+ start:735 stop:1547 length:813 start_codon:yes stop_codon:yes gene_type:complete
MIKRFTRLLFVLGLGSIFTLSAQAKNLPNDISLSPDEQTTKLDTAIVINEVMASNDVTVADNAGDFDDWIELFNTSGSNVDLSGWYITDKADNLTKYKIPSGTMILANDYLIIWADEDSSQGPDPVHANFKLSASGEIIMLLDTFISIVDSMSFGQQTTDMGYARSPNGTGNFIIQTPTYNGSNDGVSTNSVLRVEEFSMFPNPTSGLLNVILESDSYDYGIFEVFDVTGRKVEEISVTSPQFQLDLSTFGEGLYMMKYGETVKRVLILK